jgi:beta-lactamase regulating signal transducer with metallopeptidase domain
VWLLTLSFGKNRAAVRHRLWLAASVKFLIPFSLLAGVGSYIQWQKDRVITPYRVSAIVGAISQPFTLSDPSLVPLNAAQTPQTSWILVVLAGVWICGIAVSLAWWCIRLGQLLRTMRRSTPVNLAVPIRVMSCTERLEPGVFGIFRPILLLPEGITERLSPAQLRAVLAHELCHVRRRDNMAAAIHMIVEALFWFHPMVWWIKVRLIDEQERACDEEVLRLGNDPQVYAESILKICEFYLTSPLICVSGISGSDLKKRIEDIMRNRVALNLSLTRAGFLVVAAIIALAGPVIFGIADVKAGGAQSENTGFVASRQTVQVQAHQPDPIQVAAEPQAGTRGTSTPGPVREYRISGISVTGVKSPQLNESIRSLLGMGVGDICDESRLRKAFEDMKRLYGSLGYANLVPEPTFDFDEDRKVVVLTININEGPQFTVNRIRFTGNASTRDDVIRREVLLKEGEVFNSSLLDDTRVRLNQMGIFEEIKPEDARIDLLPNEPKLDIDIRVKEKGR